MRGIYTTYLKHHLLRAITLAKYAKALFLIYWQPTAVIGGMVLAVIAAFTTIARATAWLAPELGNAPAATLAGVLITRLALQWVKMSVSREENQ